jgi:iron(III) transport system substrate-binding protein
VAESAGLTLASADENKMEEQVRNRCFLSLWAGLATGLLLALSGVTNGAAAQDGKLVVDGEEIADAATYAAAKNEGVINVYTATTQDSAASILKGFEADTGIKTTMLRLPTEYLYQRVTAEFAANRLDADYVDLTDLPLVKDLVAKGILANPHKVPSFDRLPHELRDSEGRWYSTMRPASIIVVNTAIVKPAEMPTKWIDVLDPKWKGQIGLASIDAGGSDFTMYTYLRERIDANFWARLKAQEPHIYPAAAPAATNLARGEFVLAMLGAASVSPSIRSGAPLKIIFPSEGLSAFPIAGGLVASIKHPNAGIVFLNWMTSKRAGVFIGPTGSYAIHPDAALPSSAGVTFPPASQVWNIDPDHWESVRVSYSEEWRKIFGQR